MPHRSRCHPFCLVIGRQSLADSVGAGATGHHPDWVISTAGPPSPPAPVETSPGGPPGSRRTCGDPDLRNGAGGAGARLRPGHGWRGGVSGTWCPARRPALAPGSPRRRAGDPRGPGPGAVRPRLAHAVPALACRAGMEGEARRSLDAAAAEGFAGQRSGVEVVGLVDACTLLGDADAARLYELLLPYKDWHLAAGCAAYLAPATTTSGCWPRPRDAGGTPSGTCWRPWRRGRDSRDDHHQAEVFDAAARATRRSSSLPSDVNRGPTTSSRRHERGI
jgi:hypothetical protein